MKVFIGCLLSAFLAGFCSNLYAQSSSAAIQGKVLFEDHSPAAAATIILLRNSDSSVVKSTIAEKAGMFRFSGLQPDQYLLLVTIIGYTKSYHGPYTIADDQNFKVPEITLNLSPKQLDAVSVFSTRPEIETRPGKMVINVQNSITAAGSSAYDILRQSPGVRVDNSNNISIIGRQSAMIMIDGKPTTLTGDDLVSVLRGMQSNMIDRIELITSGSAKYDASSGGIINIILRKGVNVGANGSVSGMLGYGKYPKGGAGVVFNDRTEKLNIFGTYTYSANKTFHQFTADRAIISNNNVSDYNTSYNSVQDIYNSAFVIGTDFFVSPKHTIGFLVNGLITDESYKKNNDLNIYNQSVFDSTITANSNLARHINKINYNVNYNGKFGKPGESLSADFNYTTYDRSSAEYITNDFFDASGNSYRNPLLLQNLSPSNIHIWLSKVDFSDPLSKTAKLEAGIKYSNVLSNNDLIFGPQTGGVYQSNQMVSNHFKYNENVNAAYINFENKYDKFNLTLGLRAEQTIATGNSMAAAPMLNNNYLDFFPQMLLTYKADDRNDYSLSYNRGITRPEYEFINPFLYYVDLYDYRSGNPNLKPEYSNSIELSYNYNKSLTATLYSIIISNAYEFPFYEQNDNSKVNITTRKNLGTVYNYGVRFLAPATITNWWNANFFLDASYQRYVAYPVNGNLNKGAPDIIFRSTQNFVITKTVIAELTGYYESPNFYGVNQFKANYNVGAGASKQLFGKRGSLRLSASDIFNTLRDRSRTNYQNLNMSIVDKRESQVVRLTFTYRFGKTSVKAAKVHDTGNEEELKRTKPTN